MKVKQPEPTYNDIVERLRSMKNRTVVHADEITLYFAIQAIEELIAERDAERKAAKLYND